MGNPSAAGFVARQPGSRSAANSSPVRRRSAASLQGGGSGDAMLLHGQVAKLRIEERFMSEEVETEGVERLAIGQILSTAKDLSQQQQQHLMPSPLGLQRTFAASG